jgi:hypothetical protein
MATPNNIPAFIQAPYESLYHAETGSWIVIQARENRTWLFRRHEWKCIRFNIELKEITHG